MTNHTKSTTSDIAILACRRLTTKIHNFGSVSGGRAERVATAESRHTQRGPKCGASIDNRGAVAEDAEHVCHECDHRRLTRCSNRNSASHSFPASPSIATV